MLNIKLNNDVEMPQLGLGVYKVSDAEAQIAIPKALEVGYRAIDTASFYENEKVIGSILRASTISRGDLFITTKLWNSDQGYENTLQAFEKSIEELGLDFVDLYLIHWPCPDFDLYIESYRALEKLYQDGRVRAIGVSNFNIEHLERLLEECEIKPVINQVECHPYLQQKELKEFCEKHEIKVEAWAPLMQGSSVLDDVVIKDIAENHQKTTAQIIIRWHLQTGTIVIPKSVTPARIEENFQVFDFELSATEMEEIAALDCNERRGKEPNDMHMK